MSETIDYFPANRNGATVTAALRYPAVMGERTIVDPNGLATLIDDIKARVMQPVDVLEIAASLESLGITDPVARRRYGAGDVFELAQVVMTELRGQGLPARQAPTEPESASQSDESAPAAWKDYLRGPVATVAIVTLLLIMAAFGWLGHWHDLRPLAFSLGMTASVLVTNGWIQAFSRRSAIYIARENPMAAAAILKFGSGLALACVAILALLVLLGTQRLLPVNHEDRLTFVMAFAGFSTLWLLAGALAVVQMPGTLSLGLAGGLAAGVAVDRVAALLGLPHLLAGSAAGFLAASGIMLYRLQRGLARAPHNADIKSISLPSLAYLAYEAAPYFAYGTLYMAFIFLPHVLGWAGAVPVGQSRLSAVGTLEVGLTLALVPILLTGGLPEHTARLFWSQVRPAQRRTRGSAPDQFGRDLFRFYRRELWLYLGGLLLTSLITGGAFRLALAGGFLQRWINLADWMGAEFVFWTSLLAYIALGWGLFNCLFTVNLGRPGPALKAVWLGIVITAVLGLPLSVLLRFTYAPMAFLAGALAFGGMSFWYVRRLFDAADYYYYSSF